VISLFSHGDFSVTGCQLRQIWWLVGFSLRRRKFVWLGVGKWKRLIIYSSLVAFYETYGIQFVSGSGFLGLICIASLTIFFSLLIRQEGRQHEYHLCNSYDFYVFGYCRMNVIIEFLATRKIVYTNCWIKLNFTRTGGWRQLMSFLY